MEMPLLIYVSKVTPRVRYTFNLILKDLLGIQFALTDKMEEYDTCSGPKFSYAQQQVSGSPLHFNAQGLLFQSGIRDQSIQIHNHPKLRKYFFKSVNSDLPFDLFAASFYLVSRYEEYLPYKPDLYNRFEATSSLAFQYDFLEIPLVNIWVEELKHLLLLHYPDLEVKSGAYTFLSTIDVDNAYKFKQKGVMRTVGGVIKDIINFRKAELVERTRVLLGSIPDPFDSYDYQLSIQQKYHLRVIYFFLLGDYGVNDKNHPANNPNFQKLIKHLADYTNIGIHPSYGSNVKAGQLKIEINRLSRTIHREVEHSRQHFSMLKFPETYNGLLESGVTNDYSMGYSNYNGFRASICQPFYWYDLDNEIETVLRVHPFMISETTVRYRHTPYSGEAVSYVKPIIDEVKKYKGQLVTLFHNDTMGTTPDWKGWHQVYEDVVKEALI